MLPPQWSLRQLLATGHYENEFVRFVGAFLIAVAVLVIQIIRHRLEVLCVTTLAVRVFFLIVIAALYFESDGPLFVAIFAVVLLGFMLTLASYLSEHRAG